MSTLTDTVSLTKRAIIGFLIFSLLAIIGQFIISNLPDSNDPNGGGRTSYFLPITANTSTYSRLQLNSISTATQSNPEFVKADEFTLAVDSINVYNLDEPQVSIRALAISGELANILSLDQKLTTNVQNKERWASSENDMTMEFDRKTENIEIQRNLRNATRNPINPDFTKTDINELSRSILNTLSPLDIELDFGAATIDFVTLNSDQSFTSVTSAENAHFARVNFPLALESSSILERFRNSSLPSIPESEVSNIYLEDPRDTTITIYLNGDIRGTDNLVKLSYTNIPLIDKAFTQQSQHDIPYDFEVYPALEVGKAFEFLKAGEENSFLIYLNKRGTNTFEDVQGYNVRQYLVDATGVDIVYVMIDPDDTSEQERRLYPFYQFKGVANLDDNSQADFIFWVDAIAR